MMPEREPKPPQPARYNWSEVWTAVLTKPRVDTFHEILNDPQANARRAYVWIFFTGLVTFFMLGYAIFNSPVFQQQLAMLDTEGVAFDASTLFTSLICLTPLMGGFFVFFFILLVSAVQWVANLVAPQTKESNRFQPLAYTLGAVMAPMNLLSVLFVIVPFLGIFSLFASIYQLVLMGMGIRAVFGITNGQAATALMVPVVGFFFVLLLLGGF